MADKDELGFRLCESTYIFNILNQTDINYPRLSDPNYLLLLDTRKRKDFNQSHVLTAKFAPRNHTGSFVVPYEAELETKTHCVVYDGRTDSPNDKGSPAIACARLLWDMGSKNPVLIIKGGYELFSALYPFLRTDKMMYTSMDLYDIVTYPLEIIPGFLYSGTIKQSQCPSVNKNLKVRARINITTSEHIPIPKEKIENVLTIAIEDTSDTDFLSYFQQIVDFIDEKKLPKGETIVISSDLNISRSITAIIAYLIWENKWSLKKAYRHAKDCKENMQPSRSFIKQLSQWEERVLGQSVTDISEPDY